MEHLLLNLQPGLIAPHVEPLRQRIRALLESQHDSSHEVMSRVRLLPLASRQIKLHGFEIIATALIKRSRLKIVHYHRKKDLETQREISPQRLVVYRDKMKNRHLWLNTKSF